ncbi:MAG: NAD(P)H-dependent oxidoreductase subunit E [Akkermansiaceae bacterium]|nr:NAD(P)H-dependent oxidoreductase subunit E [Akkermansiaceae bacterium]NNM29313.1 NAD(P)H-dependent oxidoreductase subunit E [Akkermansiaceae bacterium]
MPDILQHQVASPTTPGSKHFAPFEATAAIEKAARERIKQYPKDRQRSAVLPLLHIVQHEFGFISPEAIEWVASMLEIEPIKVEEVVTFYPGLRQSAPGKFHIRVCRTLSCAMGGSYELMESLCKAADIDQSKMDPHHHPVVVSPCGTWSVEFAECLASCGTAPVCLVNDDFHEGVAPESAPDLLNQYK